MIQRDQHVTRVRELFAGHPVVAILGPRQVGKTTLARMIAARESGPVTRFDLEDPDDLSRLDEPKLALGRLAGLVVLDEVQRRPELFPILRVLVDRTDNPVRFLVLGSASPDLLRQSSESLTGRIAYHNLSGFSLEEVGRDAWPALWLRGGFPRAYLAPSDDVGSDWLRAFVRTFLERDLPQLGVRVPSTTLHRFWTMLAHYHAQVFNAAELSRAFGVSASTVRRYLDILDAALVVRQLQPWHENLKKRQVKAPKVFLADCGLLHSLLGIGNRDQLEGHPKVGASWEGFALWEVVSRLRARPEERYFWATHAGAELDLFVAAGGSRYGFELKRTTAPRTTRSMRSAFESLRLDHLYVVHAGETSYPLDHGITAVAIEDLGDQLPSLGPGR